jgi:hypothetical protein
MRLKEHINEKSRSKPVWSESDTAIAVAKECRQAVKAYSKGHRIYRGIREVGLMREIDPKKHTRTSANTNNLYTAIIDNHPEWKNYPRRSQSIICSSAIKGASPYGTIFCVFPKDGANYGVCPTNDIWGSFARTIGQSMVEFNWNVLIGIGENALGMWANGRFKTLAELKKILKEMDRRWAEVEEYEPDQDSKDDLKAKLEYQNPWLRDYKGDFYKLMMEMIVPKKNGFWQTNNPMNLPDHNTSHEVWTDKYSYLINEVWIRQNFNQLLNP